jgi:hypothetical protein
MTPWLEPLLRPLSIDTFLREYWDLRPWLGRSCLTASATQQMLSLESLESILASLHRPGDGWLQLARLGRRALPDRMLGDDGLIDMRELYAAFAQGDTLYLTKAERLAPSLMHVCRALELELGGHGLAVRQPVNAHVFLTPPGAQGFPAHRDEHASLIIQLDGAKDWTVYDRRTERRDPDAPPLRPGQVDPRALGADVLSYHLEAGDVLYVPELWAHEAQAQDRHSMHVTLRVFSLRWSDVLLAMVGRHPGLTAPVPRHLLADPAALAESLTALLDSDILRAPLARLAAEVARERGVPQRVLPDDGLRQVIIGADLDIDTVLERRAGAACRVHVEDGRVALAFPGGAVRAPAVMEEVFRFVAATPRLRPRDLPAIAGNARYDRVDVARTLVRDGLLRIADRGAHHDAA